MTDQNCSSTASCQDTFAETKDAHALAGKLWPVAKTLEDCKKACIANTSCVAIDFVEKVSECWAHLPEDGASVKFYPIHGMNHYALTRCAAGKTRTIVFPKEISLGVNQTRKSCAVKNIYFKIRSDSCSRRKRGRSDVECTYHCHVEGFRRDYTIAV